THADAALAALGLAKEKGAPPGRPSVSKMLQVLLAEVAVAVGTLEEGSGPADEAVGITGGIGIVSIGAVGVIVAVGIAVIRTAERRGGDRARGSDRGTRNARCRAYGGADGTPVMIAAVGVAIVARHGGGGHGRCDNGCGCGEFEALHHSSPCWLRAINKA